MFSTIVATIDATTISPIGTKTVTLSDRQVSVAGSTNPSFEAPVHRRRGWQGSAPHPAGLYRRFPCCETTQPGHRGIAVRAHGGFLFGLAQDSFRRAKQRTRRSAARIPLSRGVDAVPRVARCRSPRIGGSSRKFCSSKRLYKRDRRRHAENPEACSEWVGCSRSPAGGVFAAVPRSAEREVASGGGSEGRCRRDWCGTLD